MSSNSIYHCQQCDKTFNSKRAHDDHVKGSHTVEGNNIRRECGKKSIPSLLEKAKIQNNINRIKYANNPIHCKECDCCIPYDKRVNKFCSSSCAASFNNRTRIKNGYTMPDSARKSISNKLSRTLTINKITKATAATNTTIKPNSKLYSKLYICKSCGKCHKSNQDKLLCHCGLSNKHQLLTSLVKYFNFNQYVIGTKDVSNEYLKCKSYIQELYNENSLPSLCKLVGHNDAGNMGKILKSIGITLDDVSSAQSKSYLQNRSSLPISPNSYFIQGWYTTKTGNEYYYRSSYELKFIHLLEEFEISFQMEVPFKYYDSQQQKYRTALPDFVFDGKIVEIKGDYTFDEINMKDKFKSYIDHGYDPILQLEFKYYRLIDGNFIEDVNFKLT